jgi:ribosomal protein S18 acetylase RimI-like enzyme
VTASRSPITIRPATVDDAEAVAAIVHAALRDKYAPALGAAALRGIAALTRWEVEDVPSSRHWVAEIDDRLAGVVHMAIGPAGGEGFSRALAREIGWPRAVRATLVLSMLAHGRIAADEAYVEELAVAGWARRRGVARALLAACEEEARRAGRGRLTLWVTTNNAAALPLYADTGFRESRRRRWLVGRLLFRAPGAILMERPLAPR